MTSSLRKFRESEDDGFSSEIQPGINLDISEVICIGGDQNQEGFKKNHRRNYRSSRNWQFKRYGSGDAKTDC
jgi:hypothetical protein